MRRPFAKQRLVVGDDDAGTSGSSTSSVNPSPGAVHSRGAAEAVRRARECPSIRSQPLRESVRAAPVVGNLKEHCQRSANQLDLDVRASACLAHVGQRFERGAVQRQRDRGADGRGVPAVLNTALNVSSRTGSTREAIVRRCCRSYASSRSAFTDWRTAVSPSFASACARLTASIPDRRRWQSPRGRLRAERE